jgi:hypothetical protein
MTRILIVAQEVGGAGKSTLVRAVAEAVPDAPLFEIESTQRILEYDYELKAPKRVTHFPVRADRAAIESSGGQAARQEFDRAINAMVSVVLPTVVDIGANTARSFISSFDDELEVYGVMTYPARAIAMGPVHLVILSMVRFRFAMKIDLV